MEETFFYRWSRFVQRRAWVAHRGGVILLVIVAIPAFSVQLGFADASNDPEGTTTREASDLLTEGFGPGANGPLIVITELPEGANVQELQSRRQPIRTGRRHRTGGGSHPERPAAADRCPLAGHSRDITTG